MSAYGKMPRPDLRLGGRKPVIFLSYNLVRFLESVDFNPMLSIQVVSIITLTGATILHELAHLCWQYFHLSGSMSGVTPFHVRFPHPSIPYYKKDGELVDLTQSDPNNPIFGESGYALEGLIFNGVLHPVYKEGHRGDLAHLDGLYIKRVVDNKYIHRRRYVLGEPPTRPSYPRCLHPSLTPRLLTDVDYLYSLANAFIGVENNVPNLWVDGSMLTAILPARVFHSQITDTNHFRPDHEGELKYYDPVEGTLMDFRLVDRAFEDFDDFEETFGLRH